MDAGIQNTATTAALITAIVESEIIKGSSDGEDSNRIQVFLSEVPLIEQLHIAGRVLVKLSLLYAARAEVMMGEWEHLNESIINLNFKNAL